MRSSQGKSHSINALKVTQFIFNSSLEKSTWANSTSQTEKFTILKRVSEARARFIGSTDLKISDERKRVENENVLVEDLVDENVNYDNVSSFNADITNRNQGEDLDESKQANEGNKHNKFRENLSQKHPRVNLTACDLNGIYSLHFIRKENTR